MNSLLLHPNTANHINGILKNKPHAVLIVGKPGSGKTTLAKHIAVKLLEVNSEKLATHPYVSIIEPEDSGISIEHIRALKNFLRLRVPSSNQTDVNRIIIINSAEKMRSEAQNALLKTLEEPPKGTVLIATTQSPKSLLPTITSRMQLLHVLPVGFTQAKQYFGSTATEGELQKQYALSQGQAGLLVSLVGDNKHPVIEDVNLAKSILAESIGQRLLRVEALSKDKQAIARLLDALLRISHAGLNSASKRRADSAIKQWHHKQYFILKSIDQLQKNVQTKLLLDNLFLNI